MKSEVVYGNEMAIEPGAQSRGCQAGHTAWCSCPGGMNSKTGVDCRVVNLAETHRMTGYSLQEPFGFARRLAAPGRDWPLRWIAED